MIKSPFPQIKQCTSQNCNHIFEEKEVQYQIRIYWASSAIYGGILCIKCYDNFKKIFLNQPKFCGHYGEENEIVIGISPSSNYLNWCLECFKRSMEPKKILLKWEDFFSLLEQETRKIALKIASSNISGQNKNKGECPPYEKLIEIIIREESEFPENKLEHSVKCEKCAGLIAYLQGMFEATKKIKVKPNINHPCPNPTEIWKIIIQCLPYLTKHEDKIRKKDQKTLNHLKECQNCKEYMERLIDEISKRKYFFQNH